MTFLAIVLALLLLQWWGSGGPVQWDGWVHALRGQVQRVPLPALHLPLLIALPVLLIVLLDWALRSVWYGLPLFLLYLLVLLYSMGRGDLRAALDRYLDAWQRGDTEAACELAVPLGVDVGEEGIESDQALHERVRESVLYLGLERWFVVVFWFFLLGPAVALAYRLLAIEARHDPEAPQVTLAAKLLWLLEWLPVRFLGLAFALTGSFVDCFREWQHSWTKGEASATLLARFQRAALLVRPFDDGPDARFRERAADELREVGALLTRSVICWVFVMAAVQLL